jgi:hypothetical protein
MLNHARAVARALLAIFARRANLIRENLVLRQQPAVLRRKQQQAAVVEPGEPLAGEGRPGNVTARPLKPAHYAIAYSAIGCFAS